MPLEGEQLEYRRRMGGAFRSLPREHGFERLEIEGELPAELEGTLYKNGPAMFEAQGTPYRHWLDGDGGISAVLLRGGEAHGACRVTATQELVEERASGRMLYSSGFSVGPDWHRRLFGRAKNTCSIHVLVWRGRLFAMTEAGLPYELDPATLETKASWDVQGVARQGLNAHVRIRPENGDVIASGTTIGVRNTLDVYVLPAKGPPRVLAALPCDRPPLLAHDLVITERHAVLVLPPVRVRMAPIVMGMGSPMDAISFHEGDGSEIIVIPFDAPENTVRFRVPAFFHFHYANAFEQGKGRIAVDLARYPGFDLGAHFMLDKLRSGQAWADVPIARFERLWLDLGKQRAEWEPLVDLNLDFMQTHPARQGKSYRYTWSLVNRDHRDEIEKLDLETKESTRSELDPFEYPGEPTFVPRPGASDEDDGWLLTLGYDAERETSHLIVLDAKDPRKVLARARFDHHLPFPLHGAWAPA